MATDPTKTKGQPILITVLLLRLIAIFPGEPESDGFPFESPFLPGLKENLWRLVE